ncbi:MAG: hypothetical protein IH946_03140 [Bacteroidetes bacterium]|nr:hypothetical protein [Bacteroidota bacterium]
MELGKKKSGDYFNIYIEAAQEEWYYFSYKNKILSILTSNLDFTTALTEMPLDKRKIKGDNKEIFVFQKGGTKIQKNAFVQTMKGYQNK